jgi:hypothetical protein
VFKYNLERLSFYLSNGFGLVTKFLLSTPQLPWRSAICNLCNTHSILICPDIQQEKVKERKKKEVKEIKKIEE